MQIELNGQSLEVADRITFAALIELQCLGSARVAIEANGAIVPRSEHATRQVQAGDRIEIVHALGGG